MPKKIKTKAKKQNNLDSAVQHYQSGKLQEAETICNQILQKNPNHSDTLHMLGLIFVKSGQFDIAADYISKAIEANPEVYFYYFNLGNVFAYQGNIHGAIRNFRKTIEIKPDYAEAYSNLGVALKEKGKLDEAIDNYRKALTLKPDYAEVYSNLGVALKEKGKLDEAIDNYRKALTLKPDFAEACRNLGVALASKGKLDEAIECYKKALTIIPSDAEIYSNLGTALANKGMSDEAIDNYRKALTLKPDYAEAYINLGTALKEKGMIDEAIDNYRKALKLKPDFAEIYSNLGTALADKGMADEAIDNYRKALKLKPDFAEAYYNLGTALKEKGIIEEAIEKFNKALMLKSDYAEAHFNISLLILKKGVFKQGWRKYEWRFLQKDNSLRPFPQPVWDGSPLKGRTLLIHAEQGVGDEIMFASCLPDVISQGGHYVFECDRRLMPLFSRSFPEVEAMIRLRADEPDQGHLPHAEVKIAIGSLPLFYRSDFDSFPQQKSYLVPDKQKVEIWNGRFKKLGDGLKVGISWSGGKNRSLRQTRSIPLEQWSQVFSLQGVHFINLQYGDCAEELKDIKETQDITIHDWDDTDPLKDLDGFAAQISALDLVISVDNSTVHMAGALGTPVWALLPFVSDWRWMQDFDDTPWYESVRLFRQRSLGDWESVLERVVSDLREFFADGVMPEIDIRYSYKKIDKGIGYGNV